MRRSPARCPERPCWMVLWSMTAPDPSRVWQRVEGWMRHAAEDARMARGLLHMEPPARGGAAYHCQQAAEKLLKGFLVRENIDFARTHDLDRLGHAVAGRFPAALQLIASMRAWTTWGVAYRYPGDSRTGAGTQCGRADRGVRPDLPLGGGPSVARATRRGPQHWRSGHWMSNRDTGGTWQSSQHRSPSHPRAGKEEGSEAVLPRRAGTEAPKASDAARPRITLGPRQARLALTPQRPRLSHR